MTGTQEQQPEVNVAALLAKAGEVPKGLRLEDFDPMEKVPTASFGEEIQPGMTISGNYVETQKIPSHKFTKSKEKNAAGVPLGTLHVFKLVSGDKLGIWTTAEMRMLCEKLNPNEFVSITYKGKGTNDKGDSQHFLAIKRETVNH